MQPTRFITIVLFTGIFALLGVWGGVQAQSTLRVSGGTKLSLSGNVQFVLGGGNVVNNGTIGGQTGTIVFAGPVNFSGTGYTQVANLLVSHPSNVESILNAPINITNTATLMFGNLLTNDQLVIRSDLSTTANLVVAGTPTAGQDVKGLIAKAAPAYGPCPGFPSVLSVNVSGAALHYQWQSSSDSLGWTDIAGATSHDYNAAINGTVYYRCHVTTTAGFDETLPAGRLGLDTVAAITGVSVIAVGNTSALTSTTGGGTWASSDASVVRVNPSTGLITGVHVGSATITYTVVNINACSRNTSTVLQVTPGNKPVVVVTDPAAICAPAGIDLTAPAVVAGSDTGLTYKYYTDPNATPLANPSSVTVAGTYYLTGTDRNGTASDPMPVTVTIIQAQNVKAAFSFSSYCINQAVQFTNTSTVTGTVTYSWSDNAGNSSSAASPSFTYISAGNRSVTLRLRSVACPSVADSLTQVVPVEQPVPAIRMPKVTVGLNEPIELRARNFGASYSWTPATGLSNTFIFNPRALLPANEQEYRISIKALSGCVTVDTLLVQVFDKRIYVPNVFTPNGDGINDKLYVNIIGTNIRQLTFFRIYNRYSKLVFETSDATVGWDGRWNGVLQPMDTYVWFAEARDTNGALVSRSGNVTLLR